MLWWSLSLSLSKSRPSLLLLGRSCVCCVCVSGVLRRFQKKSAFLFVTQEPKKNHVCLGYSFLMCFFLLSSSFFCGFCVLLLVLLFEHVRFDAAFIRAFLFSRRGFFPTRITTKEEKSAMRDACVARGGLLFFLN